MLRGDFARARIAMKKKQRTSHLDFDKSAYAWKPDVDYRRQPERYKVGKGEQGVLICEPYKSELTPHWRFKTPEIAQASSMTIYKMFRAYLKKDDFVGADMARKFLQMGYTRARRYANYKGGKKYDKERNHELNERGTGESLSRLPRLRRSDRSQAATRATAQAC